jgi:hypothetical protein
MRLALPTALIMKSRNGETYIVTFDLLCAESRTAVLRTLGKWAADPDLDFSHLDAAIAARKLRPQPPEPTAPNWWQPATDG